MGSYIIRKLLYGLAVLFGVVSLVFFLFTILPGDPARMMLGQRADQQAVDNIRSELGLDQPVIVQYAAYLNDLSPISVHNSQQPESFWFYDQEKYKKSFKLLEINQVVLVIKSPWMRMSYQSRRAVTALIAEAFPKTLLLAGVSVAIAFVVGLSLGFFAAVVNKNWMNRLVLIITSLGMSVPSFFAAILMAWIFGFVLSEYTGLEMFGSLYTVDDYGNGASLDLKNLILPAITLGIRPLAIVTELTRTSLLEVMGMDYIRTAKAKGLPMSQVIGVHALRNALNPVVTAVSGWFASLMAGAVFVEYVFDWKGIGMLIVDALEKYDLPVIMGAVLLIAFILIIINIFVDIVYGILDPRIRLA
ncbi:MAG: ABC transporter permease [Bacteroidales bacterium]|nr:ABC transporter permease [Bacteroidales bacterium]